MQSNPTIKYALIGVCRNPADFKINNWCEIPTTQIDAILAVNCLPPAALYANFVAIDICIYLINGKRQAKQGVAMRGIRFFKKRCNGKTSM